MTAGRRLRAALTPPDGLAGQALGLSVPPASLPPSPAPYVPPGGGSGPLTAPCLSPHPPTSLLEEALGLSVAPASPPHPPHPPTSLLEEALGLSVPPASPPTLPTPLRPYWRRLWASRCPLPLPPHPPPPPYIPPGGGSGHLSAPCLSPTLPSHCVPPGGGSGPRVVGLADLIGDPGIFRLDLHPNGRPQTDLIIFMTPHILVQNMSDIT